MKKIIPLLLITLLVLGTIILWIAGSEFSLPVTEIVQFAVIILLVGFGIYIAITRLRSVRRGEPAEDELSKRIMQKASSLAFYISIYVWLAISYMSEHLGLRTGVWIGAGIVGMALLWAILVIYFKLRGLKDA